MKFQNPLLAVFALLISLGFWVYVSIKNENPDVPSKPGEWKIEVDLSGLPPDFIKPSIAPTVYLIAKGKKEEIDRLTDSVNKDRSQIEVRPDLSKPQIGNKKYPLQVQVPTGFDVTWDLPKDVLIPLDRQKTREIPVEVVASGLPPEGYLSDRQVTEPRMVSVSGPSLKIDAIEHARVALDLSELKPSQTSTASVQRPVELLESGNVPSSAQATPSQVVVYATLFPKPTVARMLINPVFVGTPAFGYRVVNVLVEPNQAIMRGPSESLARQASVDTKQILISGLKETKQFVTSVQLPDGLKEVRPRSVRVTVVIATVNAEPRATPTNVPAPNPTGTPPPQ